jgi:hypothetical protein
MAWAIVAAAAFVPSAAGAAEDESRRWLGGLTTVAAGWYVDARCNALDKPARRALEWHAVFINNALEARRVPPERIAAAARAAEAAAGKPELAACGAASRSAIDDAVALAPRLLKDVANRTYDPKTSYRDYALARMAKVTAALRLAERCKYMPPALADDVKRVQTRVIGRMIDDYGAAALYGSLHKGFFDAGGDELACGAQAQQIYLRALADLRALEAEFAGRS